MAEDKIPLYISRALYDIVKRRVEANKDEFRNVDEYVEYVLTEVTKEEAEKVYTKEEEEEIRKRLSNLGYV